MWRWRMARITPGHAVPLWNRVTTLRRLPISALARSCRAGATQPAGFVSVAKLRDALTGRRPPNIRRPNSEQLPVVPLPLAPRKLSTLLSRLATVFGLSMILMSRSEFRGKALSAAASAAMIGNRFPGEI